jgi:hypothetical protein
MKVFMNIVGQSRLCSARIADADKEGRNEVKPLIDFSPLRAELVTLTGIRLDASGQTPFDPVSPALCCLLRWGKGVGWKGLVKTLAGPGGGCWRRPSVIR